VQLNAFTLFDKILNKGIFMPNQRFSFTIKSALILTCLLSAMQGCAGETLNKTEAAPATKTTETTPETEAKNKAETTQTVFKVVTKGVPAYTINDQQNPELTLKRGVTYTFELKTTGHPFWIKTKNSTGKANAYEKGVTGNGTERGTLTFAVPKDAPALLHYNCEVHDTMNNKINIID
jgi:hypothetical protein